MDHVRSQLPVSERRACHVVGQSRATQRRQRKIRNDEAGLTAAIVRLATMYGRYGYRRIRQLLVDEGWRVSVKRVYRIWRREGLKVPLPIDTAATEFRSTTLPTFTSDPVFI